LSPTWACKNFDSSNNRRLSVCSRIWISDTASAPSRGVVEMHSYILVNGHWIDVTSQSITVNDADFSLLSDNGQELGYVEYGNDVSARSCRVNGPSSSQIACSVPNTGRVAFYSPALNQATRRWRNCIGAVSWRDDVGQPHYVTIGDASHPDKLPLCFEY
jgi:hypothetical protein